MEYLINYISNAGNALFLSLIFVGAMLAVLTYGANYVQLHYEKEYYRASPDSVERKSYQSQAFTMYHIALGTFVSCLVCLSLGVVVLAAMWIKALF